MHGLLSCSSRFMGAWMVELPINDFGCMDCLFLIKILY